MKVQYLIIFLIFGLFSQLSWAPPIKGGAAVSDISKCELDTSKQTKVIFTDKSGKELHICTGLAACAGKIVPVSCKVSERELCPISKQCITFDDLTLPGDGWLRIVECVPGPDDGYYRLGKPYKFEALEKIGDRWVPANNLEWTFNATHQEIWRKPDSIEVKFTVIGSKVQATVRSKISNKGYTCMVHLVK